MDLGPFELAALLLWVLGVTCAVLGSTSRLFSVRETIVAMAVSLVVPVIGSLAAVCLYWSRRTAAGTHTAS